MSERSTQILRDTDTQMYTQTVTHAEEGGHRGGTEAKGNTPRAHWGGGRTRLTPGRLGALLRALGN